MTRKQNLECVSDVPSEDDVALLERYVALLKELRQLADYAPTDAEMQGVACFVANLRKISEHDYPTEGEMRIVASHVTNLREIEERELE